MRFNKLEGDHRHYWISEIEKSILENLLQHYPVLDPGYQQISRFMESELSEEPQELLEECMTESQEESRKWIKTLLDPASRLLFSTDGSSQWDLVLSGEDYETLLQVLNDLRVGFWLELGSPEESVPDEDLVISDEDEAKWALFQFTAYFQSHLLLGSKMEDEDLEDEDLSDPDLDADNDDYQD